LSKLGVSHRSAHHLSARQAVSSPDASFQRRMRGRINGRLPPDRLKSTILPTSGPPATLT
jgi:hypothetical protein